ncbi:hypothetical protein ETAA8_50880 [Anatilimnocola aggregata]|uniref:RiboL-PSP-HEPN domain-containing protein n=1 Tax=Anatilimnocola aggregata TaxID=2528021 RepID=A0A517YIB2_9BACT|nr:HEPN domain-containing protein [Anatilimnocola aggregata]QDU29970.1 hypothetical protein ETAA8_50880 [Anatilimnocola aggregata]
MATQKTKSLERHKAAVQGAFDFAVTICYSIPQLSQHLAEVESGKTALQQPHYFAPQNSTVFLKDNVVEFENRLSTYLLLSIFSFFESYIKSVVTEMLEFHGGADAFLALAEKRDRTLTGVSETADVLEAKKKLRKDVSSKYAKYQKYSKVLRAHGYRFPSERLSSYGARMLISELKKLKAAGIPDLLEHGLSVRITSMEKTKFNDIKKCRNNAAHGTPTAIDLSYIRDANEFFRDWSFRIDSHLIEHFFVVGKYAY